MKRIYSYLTTIAATVILLTACKKTENVIQPPGSIAVTSNTQEEYKRGVKGDSRELLVTLPFSKNAQKVNVEIIDGLAIMEGDIILKSMENSAANPNVNPNSLNAVAIDGSGYRWPNSVIPYVISSGHPDKTAIEWAINHVTSKTNLCLVPRTNQADYIQFVTGSGCASYVGRQGGRQNITIGGCGQGSVAHEILHSAGLWHEQSREDRDNYITINWANIQAGYSSNFNKHVSDGIDIGTYDYGSIMHYPKTGFSVNGLNTISIKIPPGTATTVIGQRTAMSTKDKNAINSLYAPGPCKEDCISFNPDNVAVKLSGTKWLVVDGNHSMFSAPNFTEAYRIVQIIKYYKLTSTCYAGRPDPSFQYMLRNGSSPIGAMAGEDCIPFVPANLYIKAERTQYVLTDGISRMFVFPNKIEADLTLTVIKKYGFTRSCYVGRPRRITTVHETIIFSFIKHPVLSGCF